MELIILYLVIYLFGCMIGSFSNVCIYRLPAKTDIVSKRSHCMSCGNVLNWYELVPILSYMLQRGKCRHCGQKVSIQYPLVEMVSGIAYIWVFMVHGFYIISIVYCLCASALIIISVIDWRTYEIPLGCNLFIGALAILLICLYPAQWHEYVVGFFCVSSAFLIIYLITKGRGIGGGDIKLMAAAGLLLGWKEILLALAIGAVVGSVIHICLMKLGYKERVLAFGPYLSIGIFITMLYGNRIINWYIGFYQ